MPNPCHDNKKRGLGDLQNGELVILIIDEKRKRYIVNGTSSHGQTGNGATWGITLIPDNGMAIIGEKING